MKASNTAYNELYSDFCKYNNHLSKSDKYEDNLGNVKLDVLTGEITINGKQEYLIPENKTIWKI